MAFKYRLTPRGMVLYILAMYPGEFLSIKDIQEKILKHFECSIYRQTIVAAIDEGDNVTGNIIEKTERRGKLKLHVKVFSIDYSTDNNLKQ